MLPIARKFKNSYSKPILLSLRPVPYFLRLFEAFSISLLCVFGGLWGLFSQGQLGGRGHPSLFGGSLGKYYCGLCGPVCLCVLAEYHPPTHGNPQAIHDEYTPCITRTDGINNSICRACSAAGPFRRRQARCKSFPHSRLDPTWARTEVFCPLMTFSTFLWLVLFEFQLQTAVKQDLTWTLLLPGTLLSMVYKEHLFVTRLSSVLLFLN